MAWKARVGKWIAGFIIIAVLFFGMALIQKVLITVFGPGIMSTNLGWQSSNSGSNRSGDEEDEDESASHSSGDDD